MGLLEFVMLGEVFIWICEMFVLVSGIGFFVKFYRNNVLCVLIGLMSLGCVI